ncbi:hypothetical protein Tco_0850306 [Tanacetum coccineum]
MEKIKTANPRAHEYLLAKGSKTWSRAFFTEGRCCKAVENGFSECFNSVLVSIRHQPIITMLESIRVIVMERINTMRILMEKWSTDVCPNIQKILEHSKDQQRFWHVIPCGDNQFEVRRGSDAFKVDEPNRTCSCRMYMLTYSNYMKPVDGIKFWPDCSNLSRILGPKPRKMPGRPRKKRFRAAHETKSNTRIPRAGFLIRCHNCWEIGHNKKGCKKEPIPVILKEKKKAGRPKKIQNTKSVDDDNDVPLFVNNDINEFEMGASNSKVVFNDGRVFNVGRFGFNKKKKFGSSSTGHVKIRGGKTKGGRLFPTQRLGRMGMWLGMDGATSDTIEETEPLQPSLPVLKNPSNLPGVGGMENYSLPPRNQTRSFSALQRASVIGGVQTTTTTSVRGGTKTRGGTNTRGTIFIPLE